MTGQKLRKPYWDKELHGVWRLVAAGKSVAVVQMKEFKHVLGAPPGLPPSVHIYCSVLSGGPTDDSHSRYSTRLESVMPKRDFDLTVLGSDYVWTNNGKTLMATCVI